MSHTEEAATTKAQQVIDTSLEAYKICLQTAAYCAAQGGALASAERLQVLHDCADINLLLAQLLARASRFHRPLADLCMDVSRACAEAFSADEHDDGQLRVTYAACIRSARSCAELLGREEEIPMNDARDEAIWESFPASDAPPPPTQI